MNEYKIVCNVPNCKAHIHPKKRIMTITSEDIMIDCDNPSQERLIIKANSLHNYFDDEIVDVIHQKQDEGWNFETRLFHSPQVVYIIFTRPVKTEIEWFGKMIDDRPLDKGMLFHTEQEAEKWLAQFSDIVFGRQ